MLESSNPPIGFEAHFEAHDLAQEWQSDFYAYFEAPENASRYLPATSFVTQRFGEKLTLLDLACGSGALLRYLPRHCQYLGVDHNADALRYCQQIYPHRQFIESDVLDYLENSARDAAHWEVIMLCGLLFNSVHRTTRAKVDDLQILRQALQSVRPVHGVVVLIVPFVFSNHPEYSLLKQAAWKLDSIERLIQACQPQMIVQNMSVQLGLEQQIMQQTVYPDWFVPPGAKTSQKLSRWQGPYMGSWTIIVE